MAGLGGIEQVFGSLQRVVGGDARRFVDDQNTVDRPSPLFTPRQSVVLPLPGAILGYREIDQRRQLLPALAAGVVVKTQLGNRAHADRLGRLGAEESGRAVENLDCRRRIRFVLGHDKIEIHLGLGEVAADLDHGDIDDPQAGIVHLIANELGELPLQGIGNPVGTAEFFWHVSSTLARQITALSSELARDLLHIEHFDLIAGPDVVVVLDPDAALGPAAHLADIILEAPQRLQHTLVDHHVVAQYADGLAAVNRALGDDAPGNLAELGRTEYFPNLGDTDDLLADLRRQHPRQRLLDVIQQSVDHAVVADFDAFGFRQLAAADVGAHIEADHHGTGGQRQVDIRLGETADTGGDHIDRHFVVLDVAERSQDRLQGAAHIRLEHNRQHFLLDIVAKAGKHALQLRRLLAGHALFARLLLAEISHFPGFPLIGHDDELVAGVGGDVEADDLHRNGRTRLGDRPAVLVIHQTDLANALSGQNKIPLAQSAGLYQRCSHHAAAFLQPRLDDDTL